MVSPQHVEWLLEGVDAWNARRRRDEFVPDLSSAQLQDSNLIGADLDDARLDRAYLHSANLSNANLRRADLTRANLHSSCLVDASLQGATLTQAILAEADLSGADLSSANLSGSWLDGATLNGADLGGATLTGADLYNTYIESTELVSADLTDLGSLPQDLWKARLFASSDAPGQLMESPASVENVSGLLTYVRKLHESHDWPGEEVRVYYRGEPQDGCALRPSIMRDGALRASEGRMLMELITRRPSDFSEARSALAQWVLARHHGLPTRFLDITRNPLVALFFASERADVDPADGRLHVFAVPASLIKPFTSDTVSIIANLAKLPRDDQDEIMPTPGGGYSRAMRRLYELIREEKPNFDERIDPRDYYRVFIVEPLQASERMRAQAGAFIASAFHARFEREAVLKWNANIPLYGHYEVIVPAAYKEGIQGELRSLNVTREQLFPGLEASAETITAQVLTSATSWQSLDDARDIRFSGDCDDHDP